MFGLLETKKLVKKHKVIGRGGKRGKSSGRGRGGQHSRTGSNSEIGVFFEGGQMPYFRRLPRRGFTAFQKIDYEIVKLKDIQDRCAEGTVGVEELKNLGLVKGGHNAKVKVLSDGGIDKKINLVVNAISRPAKEMVEKAGGSVSLI